MHTNPNPSALQLVVVNVSGVAEERGFRLFWDAKAPGDGTRVPVLGYATSAPFRTEGAAREWARRNTSETPKRKPYTY